MRSVFFNLGGPIGLTIGGKNGPKDQITVVLQVKHRMKEKLAVNLGKC